MTLLFWRFHNQTFLNNCSFCGRQKVLLSVTALAMHRSFTGFAGKLPSSFFFWRALVLMCLCPWSSALASSFPVLGLKSVCPRKGCPWPQIFFVSLSLASNIFSSTPPLLLVMNSNFLIFSWNFFLQFHKNRPVSINKLFARFIKTGRN